MLNKIVVRTENEDGPVVLAVKQPSPDARTRATLHRGKSYGKAVSEGWMVRQQLDHYLRNMTLWDDDKEAAFQGLREFILANEMKLAKGGIRKSEAYAIAKLLRGARAQVAELLSARREIEAQTADAYAEQCQFEFLVAACTTYDEGPNEGKPYFTGDGVHYAVDAYKDRSTRPDGRAAAEALSTLIYGQVDDAPEEAFLKEYGYVDKDGRLVDKQGRLVDGLGRLIDAEGYFINEAGERVDADGNRVDASGKYVVEFTPFLDDDDDEGEPAPDEPEGDRDATAEEDDAE